MEFVLVVRRTREDSPLLTLASQFTFVQMWETIEKVGVITANLMWYVQPFLISSPLCLTASVYAGPVLR